MCVCVCVCVSMPSNFHSLYFKLAADMILFLFTAKSIYKKSPFPNQNVLNYGFKWFVLLASCIHVFN